MDQTDGRLERARPFFALLAGGEAVGRGVAECSARREDGTREGGPVDRVGEELCLQAQAVGGAIGLAGLGNLCGGQPAARVELHARQIAEHIADDAVSGEVTVAMGPSPARRTKL